MSAENVSKAYVTKEFSKKVSKKAIPLAISECLKILCKSYYDLLDRKIVLKDWVEDLITDKWSLCMQINCASTSFLADPQSPIEPKNKKVGALKKIDLEFKYKKDFTPFFGVECKIIDRNNSSDFSFYLEEKGMGRFISCAYSRNSHYSAMAGYVRFGDPKIRMKELLKYAEKETPELLPIEKSANINSFDDIYESVHYRVGCVTPIKIYHLILAFDCK